MIKWNEQQRYILDNTDGNMVVSASAGSGKTAVMVERVIRLITDGVSIDRIMALTFTKVIAAELKDKIKSALLAAVNGCDKERTNYVIEQLDKLPLAQISTFHAYCYSLIKAYAGKLGLSSSMELLDAKEQETMSARILQESLDEYRDKFTDKYLLLTARLGGAQNLSEVLEKLYSVISGYENKDEWLEKSADAAYRVPYADSELVRDYFDKCARPMISGALKYLSDPEREPDTSKLSEGRAKTAASIKVFIQELQNAINLDGLRRAAKSFETFPANVRTAKGECPETKAVYDAYHDTAKKLWQESLELTEDIDGASYDREAAGAVKTVGIIVEILKLFNFNYSREKISADKLDYSDLEYYAEIALKDNEIREREREKYDYICVDEYQDTNGVQDSILNGISRSNLLTVGDIKQSIYAFRGADPGLFVDKTVMYAEDESSHSVRLNDNYRSDPVITEFINGVFAPVMTREFGGADYDAESRLQGKTEYLSKSVKPPAAIWIIDCEKQKTVADNSLSLSDTLYQLESGTSDKCKSDKKSAQGYTIASDILMRLESGEEIYDAKTKAFRQLALRDVTVLTRTRAEGEKIADALEKKGIPTQRSIANQPSDASAPLDLMRLLYNFYDDKTLISTLTGYYGGMELSELAAMRGKEKYFYECFLKAAGAEGSKAAAFMRRYAELRKKALRVTPAELTRHIVYDTGYADYLKLLDDGTYRSGVLEKLIQYVANSPYSTDLAGFIGSVDGIEVALSAPERAIDANANRGAVTITTYHNSKGLEYPVVYVAGIERAFTMPDSSGEVLADKKYGLTIKHYDDENRTVYDGSARKMASKLSAFKQTEEEMRLFYVALTRAKNNLIIVASAGADALKQYSVRCNSCLNMLVNAKLAGGVTEYFNTVAPQNEAVSPKVIKRYVIPKETDTCNETEILNDLHYRYPYAQSTLTGIKYSVTGINKMLNADSAYKRNVYAEGDASAVNAFTGSDYHKIMELIDYGLESKEDVARQIKQMYNDGVLHNEKADAEVIWRCLKSEIIAAAKRSDYHREKRFTAYLPLCELVGGGVKDKVLVQGVIDLLIIGEENILVDFKTTNRSAAEIKKSYRNQLSLYKRAAEASFDIKLNRSVIYVLGRDEIIEM